MAKYEQGMVVQHSPLGHESLTVGVSAIGFADLPEVDRVRRVVIRTLNQPVCWRDDGTDPTSSTGMYLGSGDTLVYDATEPNELKFIRASDATGDADVRVAYYGI